MSVNVSLEMSKSMITESVTLIPRGVYLFDEMTLKTLKKSRNVDD